MVKHFPLVSRMVDREINGNQSTKVTIQLQKTEARKKTTVKQMTVAVAVEKKFVLDSIFMLNHLSHY